MEEEFKKTVNEKFPVKSRRNRSGLIRQAFSERIIRNLKTLDNEENRFFRYFVKNTGFKLLDLPEAGLRDVLVVSVNKDKEVSFSL